MSYEKNTKKENPLWRNYLNTLNSDTKWMKKINFDLPWPSNSYAIYSRLEFESLLETNIEFNERWGSI